MNIKRQKKIQGFSLVEILIVLFIFSIIFILTTQSLALSLRGALKSDSLSEVKKNVDFSLNTMDRLIRNAQSMQCQMSGMRLEYVDQDGNTTSLECLGGTDGYIASGSAGVRLTSPQVDVDCSGASGSVFVCTTVGENDSVDISVTAESAYLEGTEKSQLTSGTKVNLRNY